MTNLLSVSRARAPLIAVLDSNVYLELMEGTPLQGEPSIQFIVQEAKHREVYLHWETAHLELTLDGPKANLCPHRLHHRLGLPGPRISPENALAACQVQFDSHVVNAAILCKVYSLFDQQGRRPAQAPHYIEELIRWASLELGASVGCLFPLLASWATGAGWYDGLFKYTKSLNHRRFPDRTRCAVNGAMDLHVLTTWHSLAHTYSTADVFLLTGDRGLKALVPKFNNVIIHNAGNENLIDFSLELENDKFRNYIGHLRDLDYQVLRDTARPSFERIRKARIALAKFRDSEHFQRPGQLHTNPNN